MDFFREHLKGGLEIFFHPYYFSLNLSSSQSTLVPPTIIHFKNSVMFTIIELSLSSITYYVTPTLGRSFVDDHLPIFSSWSFNVDEST